MKASDVVLNIAVNLERLSRWSQEGNSKRVEQFLDQTESYFEILRQMKTGRKFKPTLARFQKEMELLRKDPKDTYDWAERALTWANILTHRAKLA